MKVRRGSTIRKQSSNVMKQSFWTTGKKKDGEIEVPKNALSRYQFFELLVRVAIDKFGH